jgi:uncharacterized protein (TIGR00730 family)
MKRARDEAAPTAAAVENPHGVEMDESKVVRPKKAYKNQEFLLSSRARMIRIMAEHEETLGRLEANGVESVVMFFSSARGRSQSQLDTQRATAEAKGDTKTLTKLSQIEWMAPMYAKVQALSSRITRWSMDQFPEPKSKRFVVATGGGPGLMEAANRGAWEVAADRSVGMGISLPFEPGLNPYVTPGLAFEFHYFFMRKFMMVSHTVALVACPGGLGTCDELFEIMTLIQTGKHPQIPIVLLGKEYWDSIINWKEMAAHGVIAMSDLDNVLITDDTAAAYDWVTDPKWRQDSSA